MQWSEDYSRYRGQRSADTSRCSRRIQPRVSSPSLYATPSLALFTALGHIPKQKQTLCTTRVGGEARDRADLGVFLCPMICFFKLESIEPTKHSFHKQGNQHTFRQTGDLVFTVRTAPHPRFWRQNSDLFYQARISLLDALLGFRRRLTLPDGRRVKVIVRHIRLFHLFAFLSPSS